MQDRTIVAARAKIGADPLLLVDRPQAGVAVLTMNRPDTRNALSLEMIDRLHARFTRLATDRAVAAIEAMTRCAAMMQAIVACPKPVIAAVQGTATAAGCQLVATCDLAVAASEAKFATPGVNIGLFCSTPMVALSRNIGRKRAMEMLLTGDMLSAKDAADYGLINKVVAATQVLPEALSLAAKIAAKSPLTVAIGKAAFYAQAEMPLKEAYAYAAKVMVDNMMARDAEEGIGAFLDKRKPEWKGS